MWELLSRAVLAASGCCPFSPLFPSVPGVPLSPRRESSFPFLRVSVRISTAVRVEVSLSPREKVARGRVVAHVTRGLRISATFSGELLSRSRSSDLLEGREGAALPCHREKAIRIPPSWRELARLKVSDVLGSSGRLAKG